jgi:hypothetical protein
MMSRFLATIVILADLAGLTTVAEIHVLKDFFRRCRGPLSLVGIVTLVDASRNLIVLQDATGAVALHPDSQGIFPRFFNGGKVSLQGGIQRAIRWFSFSACRSTLRVVSQLIV